MKTLNVHDDRLLVEGCVRCPHCHVQKEPIRYFHSNPEENTKDIYKMFYGDDLTDGIFVICPSCREMYFIYSLSAQTKQPLVVVTNYKFPTIPPFNLCCNLITEDKLTEIEKYFKEYGIDLTQVRPYIVSNEQPTSFDLHDKDNNLICTIHNVDKTVFINNNIQVLKRME